MASTDLRCGMVDYIRPDSDLQWFIGDTHIKNGTNRRTVTYVDGDDNSAAQNGQVNHVPGRVAVLTIANPELSDGNTYTCRIMDTDQSADVQLIITTSKNYTYTGDKIDWLPLSVYSCQNRILFSLAASVQCSKIVFL